MASDIIACLSLTMQNVQIVKLDKIFPLVLFCIYWICLHISTCYNRNLWQPSFLLYLVASNMLASAAPLVSKTFEESFGDYQMPQYYVVHLQRLNN